MEIGGFTIEGELGRGSMGVVYRARGRGQSVAIKVLTRGQEATPAQLARFEQEVELLRKLRHPNLLALVDAGTVQGVPWFASALVPGCGLDELLRQRRLTVEEVVELGVQLCAGLQAMHEAGLVHRDLKPGNVRVTPDGRYVLTDLGITRDLHLSESQRLSRTGAVMGTPGFWAPEQATGKACAPSTDVYGLGATLYFVLTGRAPVEGSNFLELVIATTERAPDPPSSLVELPEWLEDVVLRCLEKAPEQRFQSADALAQALRDQTVGHPRSRRALSAAAGLGALTVLGALAWWQLSPSSPEEANKPTVAPAEPDAPQPSERDAAIDDDSVAALAELDRLVLLGKVDEAFLALERLANAGSASARLAYGGALAERWGTRAPRPKAALRWVQRALGEADATADLLTLVRRAAEANQVVAMRLLARWLDRGQQGATPDPTEALAWFKRAGEAGDVHSLVRVGSMLLDRRGAFVPPAEAKPWLERALALRETPRARSALARLLYAQDSYDLALAEEERARELYRAQLEQGSQLAGVQLAMSIINWDELRDFESVVGLLHQARAAGEPAALYHLGLLSLNGYAVPRDEARALHLLKEAAELGYVDALNEVGAVYQHGLGVEVDLRVAFQWYQRALQHGSSFAGFNVGVAYDTGQGVAQSDLEARKAYHFGSVAGHKGAMRYLSKCYREGQGGDVDLAAARLWLERGVECEDTYALDEAAGAHLDGSWGFALDAPRAKRYLERWAELDRNPTTAQFRLAKLLVEAPPGIEQDLELAEELLDRLNPEDPTVRWLRGRIVAKTDPERAFEIYLRAHEDGSHTAGRSLADAFRRGVGVERDLVKALVLYEELAEHSRKAALQLGHMRAAGEGLEQDEAAARAAFERAIDDRDDLTSRDARFELARMLLEGRGGPKQPGEARTHLERAAAFGHPPSEALLESLGER